MLIAQHDAIERLRVQVELIRQAWVQLAQQLSAVIQHCGVKHAMVDGAKPHGTDG